MQRKVLVVGALGVVGRAVMERLHHMPGIYAIGLARRKPDFAHAAQWVAADLRDAAVTKAALAPHCRAITHIVYAAVNEQSNLIHGWKDPDNAALNTRMLGNVLDALDPSALQHVTLLQGTKAYGVHANRAMPVPAREHEVLHDHVNFYFAQQELLTRHASCAGYAWTIFRPQIVLGVALASAMNPIASLAAYALLARERGMMLHYPGHPHLLNECTDARLIAEAIEWAWQTPAAHQQAFNITNGDVIVWSRLFCRIAAYFNMPMGKASDDLHLRDSMPALAAVWKQIAEREGLHVQNLDDLIGLSWQYAAATWASRKPLPIAPLVSTIKLRQAGFNSCIDTEQCVIEHFDAMRARRYIPLQ